ncbi:MAG: NUDIX hydrolase [Christensenella sp.]|uniref:NUDIX hydrolase n=1 Tax=Christensenella sp. TaxID=1935934 RepID=UPI002B212428|nr:NUDIX hydrolase [Christensenella sp.]MEA5004626.1 NUDIX hydrolase [Christensenella sp.]
MNLDEMKETTLSSESIYDGAIINVEKDTVRLPDGNTSIREVVRHPGGVSVCAIDHDLNVYFVRQFRYPFGTVLLELPAGKIDPEENPYDAALRELKEETGLVATDMISLGQIYSSVGFCDEVIHMYMAVSVEQREQCLDAGEFVKVEKIPIAEAVQMVIRGEITDAKTVASLLKAYIILDQLQQQYEEQAQV